MAIETESIGELIKVGELLSGLSIEHEADQLLSGNGLTRKQNQKEKIGGQRKREMPNLESDICLRPELM